MAKAPRRRGRGSEDEGPAKRRARPARPKSVKPIQPPAAKPVRPVAKPVPPVAKPVAPVAKPVAPVAKPVAPVARPVAPVAKPVAPVARPTAPASKPAARGRLAEEDLGGRGGAAPRRSSGRGGMSLGAKLALATGLVAFLCLGLTVLLTAGGGADSTPDAELNAYGFAVASALATPDARWWRGTATSSGGSGIDGLRSKVKTLFGERGEEWFDTTVKELSQPIPRELEGSFEAQKLETAKKAFEKAMSKLDRSSDDDDKDVPGNRVKHVWNALEKDMNGRFQIQAAWVREPGSGAGGEWVAGALVAPAGIAYAGEAPASFGQGNAYVDGKIDGVAVRMFSKPIRSVGSSKALVGFVAVHDTGAAGASKGMALGMLMLLLGTLAVAMVAFVVAGNHTKSVRGLAREIDRLGSSGDPTREIRTQGGEAALLARSVERMVANLEFREKHDGADLGEVVDREQQVAQEIHGSLMSKNPPRIGNYEVETLFKPGYEIGGDHFEYFRIDDDHLGIILLDTNVRGIQAALVMSATKSYVRAEAPGVLSPAELLMKVNKHLAGELPAGRHVTALYVVLSQKDGSATLASAGHLPLLVYRHQTGKMAKVNPEGIALGLDAGPTFNESLQEGDIPIGVGDRIVLYTDGALKIQNEEGEEFGESRFYGAVTAEAPKNSQAFVNFVGAAIDRFHLEVPQNDDITISTIKRLR
jgi:serine phosphatase RsbU (regulator of sigma subunit)